MSKRSQRRKRAAKKKVSSPVQKTGFTIVADDLEKHILEKAGEFKGAIERVIIAGMKVLFTSDMHDKIFNSIRPNIPIEDELGSGVAGLMMMLVQQSKGTMPPQAIIPAGSVLLAKACEFIDRTELAKVTDQSFYAAQEMMVAVIKREAQQAEDGSKQPQGAQPQPQGEQPQAQVPAQPNGMLQAGG